MTEDNITDETGSVSRRTVLKSTAVGGVVAATAGKVSAQEEEFEETYELIGQTSGWEGVAPSDIEGETNPTLEVIPGERYQVIWENGDGVPHNFNVVGGHGQTVQSSDLMSSEGETQTVTFTAEENYQEYFCQPHPEAMRGSFRTVSGDDGGGGSSYVLSVTVEDADGNGVAGTVTVDGQDQEITAEDSEVTYALPNGEYTVTVEPEGYYPVATRAVTVDGGPFETTITIGTESGASIDLGDQTSNGRSVTVSSVTLPEGGFVSIQDPTNFTNFDDGSGDEDPSNLNIESFFRRTILGASEYLGSGTHEDVEVELDSPFEGEMRLLAMAHEDTGDGESFDYVDSLGEEDAGYTFSGPNPVARDALMEYTEPTPTPTEEPTPEPTDEPTEAPTATSTDSPGFGGLSAIAGVGAGAAAAARRLRKGETDDDEE